MIQSLSLFNWKSHDETLLDFSKGTNVLIGIMGSGKSSILDAISFGLYGTFPNLRRGGAKLEDVIKYNQEEAKIRLRFNLEGKEYEVERIITKKSSDALLYERDVLIQKSPKAVTTEIEKILNVDYDLFNKIIYSEQNNIDYFFSLRPGKRKEEIDILLGLDRFETARVNTTKIINKVKEQIVFLKENIDVEKEHELDKKINELKEEIGELHNKKKINSKEYENLKGYVQQLGNTVLKLEKQKKEYQNLKDSIIRKEELLSKLEKELINLDCYKKLNLEEKKKELGALNIEKVEEQISELLKQNNKLISKKSKLLSDIERTNNIITQIKESQEFLKNIDIEELKKNLKNTEEKLENIKKQISEGEIKKKDLEKAVQELNTEGLSKCPVCDSELSTEHRNTLIMEKTQEKRLIQEQELELLKEKQDIKQKKEELESKIKQIEKKRDKIDELNKEKKDMTELNVQLANIENQITELKINKETLEKSIKEKREQKDKLREEIRVIEEYSKKLKEKQELDTKLKQEKDKLKELEYDEEIFNKINKELQEKNNQSNKFEYELKSINLELKNKQEILELNTKESEKINKLKKDIEYFNKKEEQYSIYKNCIIETQTEVRKGLIEAINTAMMEIWPIIYPYGDYERIRLDPQEKDYVTQLYKNNVWRDLDATASGGEKACLSLTMRIAFAMVLTPNLSWLILDEPTHNLDVQAVNMFSETLQDKIPGIVEQTFVITHDESLLNNDFNALYKLERDKTKDEATKVERIK
ncbi:AAA family ATPase [Candidatus Micrarchaeota archaeon]|nr:AAA family ATPase [Candidatus Micrarchaeota archaeon]